LWSELQNIPEYSYHNLFPPKVQGKIYFIHLGGVMKNRIFTIVVLGLFALTLTNCGAIYQGARQTNWDDSSPSWGDSSPLALLSAITPKSLPLSQTQGGQGWEHLMEIGPGSDALITLTDGTLRSGQIIKVLPDELILRVAGQDKTVARSDIVLVKVMGSSGLLAGAVIGYLASGVIITAALCDDCPGEAWLLGIALLGIPGGLVGALIGSGIGGDEEIIP
jgi:hypothetical protein